MTTTVHTNYGDITYRLMSDRDAGPWDPQRQTWQVIFADGRDVSFTIQGETVSPRAYARPACVNWCGWGDQDINTAGAFAMALATMSRKAARLKAQSK